MKIICTGLRIVPASTGSSGTCQQCQPTFFGTAMMDFKTNRAFFVWLVFLLLLSSVCAEKYRICVVDGKDQFNRSARYCPKLDDQDSPVECVVALDRLDCLRQIHKGKADFGIFTPEDLVAATNSEIEILITNELRYFQEDNFEYEVVAITSNRAHIRSKHDLRGKRYCHPGYGYEADWTRILSNYFEASVVTPQCDTQLTITENRVKASADFFGAACKAGPWVHNPALDMQLKQKYPNLCSLCGNPKKCSTQDKYWGRRGSLLCLTDGAGDISWARLEDVKQHFGFTPGGQEATPEDYSLLCPDNTIMPLNSSSPCIWVVKPWSVIATRRTKAQDIQAIIASLSHNDTPSSWKYHLLNLVELNYVTLRTLNPVQSIEGYFHSAKGFLNANSFSACHPPRTIRICTTSNIETAKCSWLRESAAVYGVEPDLDCLKADNKTHCMMALVDNAADLVMVPPDLVHQAERDFNLKTLFYETTSDLKKYITVPVTRKDTKLQTFEDLQGARACFPVHDGIAWNSVVYSLQKKHLIGCSINIEVANFFGPSCVPGIPKSESEKLWKTCEGDFEGDMGALHCLSSGVGDVAFVSSNSIDRFINRSHEDQSDYRIICQEENQPCHLSWAPLGQAMVRSSSSDMWIKDTLDVFLQLDGLFGKGFKGPTNAFTMFGRYDGATNILFHDDTEKLRDVPTVKNTDQMDLPYDGILAREKICLSSANTYRKHLGVLLVLFITILRTLLM